MFSSFNPRARGAIRSAIEAMEPRRLFAVSVTGFDSDGDGFNELIITGDSGANNVLVYDDPENAKTDVVIDSNDNGVFDLGELNYAFAQSFDEIEAELGGGNDHFTYYLASDLQGAPVAPYLTQDFTVALSGVRAVLVDLGSGTNKFLAVSPTSGVTPSGTAIDSWGPDILYGADFSVQVAGGTSTDSIAVDLSRTTIAGARVNIDINAGKGNDSVLVSYPDPDQGEYGITGGFSGATLTAITLDAAVVLTPSEVTTFVETGDGTNAVTYNVGTDIEDGSTLDINTRGGANVDTLIANVSVEAFTDSALDSTSSMTFYADLRGGNDVFKGYYDLQTGRTSLQDGTLVRSEVLGGDGNDNLRYLDVRPPNGDSGPINGLLALEARGNKGDDRVEVDLDSTGGARLTVGSTGEFRALVHGDAGNDGVFIDAVAGVGSTGLFDLGVYGDSGNDKVSLAFQNDGSNSTFNYRGLKAVLDGGLGSDKWDVEGNVLFSRLSCETLDELLQAPQ